MGIIDVSARQEQTPVLLHATKAGRITKLPSLHDSVIGTAQQSVLLALVTIFDIRCRKKRFDQGNQSTSSEKYELENILLVESSGFPANEAQWIDIKDVYIFQIDSLNLQIVCCIKCTPTSTHYGLHKRFHGDHCYFQFFKRFDDKDDETPFSVGQATQCQFLTL